MVQRVTEKYQIPTSSGRGFSGIDGWHDLYERYRNSGKERLIVVIESDLDPEGEQIPQVGGRTLMDDFGLHPEEFDIIKASVTREQVAKYNLPAMNFAKESSANLEWFLERTGGNNKVYELEALEPEHMLEDLENILKNVLDLEAFNRELEIEKSEAVQLKRIRESAWEMLKDLDTEE
ncbi:MAG TPA: hypothetical protein VK395_20010 [Gemmataceae bacterium]|nr:hypothetical protein [Gemmataceae bacterium]